MAHHDGHPFAKHRQHRTQRDRAHHLTRHYRHGGAVHEDAAEDESMIRHMVKKSALKRKSGGRVEGATPKPRQDRRARGGRTGKKGHVTVNVLAGHPGPAAAAK